ncbi:MAG: hypothetical protein KBT35_01245 [Firmicutes bacterium]|nr:hypothetical protein [Candidatus Colivicinus equi]
MDFTYEVIRRHTLIEDGKVKTYIEAEIKGTADKEKPTSVEGCPLYNGSSFLCMDTSEVYMWSQSKERWFKLS